MRQGGMAVRRYGRNEDAAEAPSPGAKDETVRSGPRHRPTALPPSPPYPTADPLAIDPELTRRWLVEFLRDEIQRRRGFEKVVVGLSGGVDSSLVAFLAAEALGATNVLGVRMPYRTSSMDSLAHAQLVIEALGIESATVDISGAVDGLASAIGGDARPRAAWATSWPGPG